MNKIDNPLLLLGNGKSGSAGLLGSRINGSSTQDCRAENLASINLASETAARVANRTLRYQSLQARVAASGLLGLASGNVGGRISSECVSRRTLVTGSSLKGVTRTSGLTEIRSGAGHGLRASKSSADKVLSAFLLTGSCAANTTAANKTSRTSFGSTQVASWRRRSGRRANSVCENETRTALFAKYFVANFTIPYGTSLKGSTF